MIRRYFRYPSMFVLLIIALPFYTVGWTASHVAEFCEAVTEQMERAADWFWAGARRELRR